MRQSVFLTGQPTASPLLSPAVIANRFVFTAGYVGWDLQTREALPDIEAQTTRTLENLKLVLETAGTSLDHVVKANVYLKDIGDFEVMNQIYARFFPQNPPARTTVGVALARADLLIEIDLIAVLPD